MNTVHEIKAEHSAKASGIMTRYQDAIQEIRDQRTLPEGAYLDRLTDGQRLQSLREQKEEKAAEAHERTVKEYGREVERYQDELAARAGHLKGRLFGVGDAGALARAATASNEELAGMLEDASLAGNEDLARAAFVAAHRRGAGDLMGAFFDRMDPEARELYAEYRDVPPPEILERQRESIGRVVQLPNPDSLTLPATVRAY